MSTFIEKSTQSINSAETLVKEHYYASTVNRAYYSYLQFLMHILFEQLKLDKIKFYKDVQFGNAGGTHIMASNLVCKELVSAKKISNSDYKWFQKTIKEFKQKRNLADYYNDVISQSEGLQSINWSKDLINCIRQNLN